MQQIYSSFIEITLRHGYSPVNVLHIFRKAYSKNTSKWLLLSLTTLTLNEIKKAILLDELQLCYQVYFILWIYYCLQID